MFNAMKKYAPIILTSMLITSSLNYFSYQATFLMHQALANTIPTELVVDIFIIIAIHTTVLSALPLILYATNRRHASYVTLILSSALYVHYMTGIAIAGPAITILLLYYLALHGYSKATSTYEYYKKERGQ